LKNKGQMFLITAVIIIVTLIILVTTSNLTNILQEKRELEGSFERDFFINIVDELVKVIEISYHQSTNITNNVFDFGNFTRKKMKERLLDFEFLFVGSITPNSNGTDTMNVSVINLLNKPISATLQLNITGFWRRINVTHAWNITKDVTAEVNASDDVYAYENCSGDIFCTSDYIYFNFTTDTEYANVTYEGYWTGTPAAECGDGLTCWDGDSWAGVGSFPENAESVKVGSLVEYGCSNADGNYTFRTVVTCLIYDGSVEAEIFVDEIYINGTGSEVKSSGMADSTRWDTNFSITQGDNYILTVSYNETYEENVTIATKSNESVYVGFFDITLIGSKTTHKDKFQKSYTLP